MIQGTMKPGLVKMTPANDAPMTMQHLAPKWMCGNHDATQFLLTVHKIVEAWDDLIDRDKATGDKEINGAFYAALITLPRNPFYAQNFMVLNPIMESAILDWHAANALEKMGSVERLRTSFVLRAAGMALTVMAAKIVGGVDWAAQVNTELRQMGDTWADYCAKHGVSP